VVQMVRFTVPDLLLWVVLVLASFAEQLGLHDPPPASLPIIDHVELSTKENEGSTWKRKRCLLCS
jgi:hypothetical protein